MTRAKGAKERQRRPQGHGSQPRETSPGTWEIRGTTPPHPDTGKTKPFKDRIAANSLREAETILQQRLAEMRRPGAVDPSKMTVGELMQEWLAVYATPRVGPKTYEEYERTVKNYVIPLIGHKQAQTLRPPDIDRFVARVTEDAPCRSAQLALMRLKQGLTWATRREMVSRNVALGIEPIVCETRKGIALTRDEAMRLIEASESDHYAPLWLLFLCTGFRHGEGLGLRWRDVDWDRSALSVRQEVVMVKSKPVIKAPKTQRSVRTIPVEPRLLSALDELKERQKAHDAALWVSHDLVFCTRNGLPLMHRNTLRSFRAICERAGLSNTLTIHHLRHTHATQCLQAGMSIVNLSQRLGHANPSITMRVYAHVLPETSDRQPWVLFGDGGDAGQGAAKDVLGALPIELQQTSRR